MNTREVLIDLFGEDENNWPAEAKRELENEEGFIAWLMDIKATIEAELDELMPPEDIGQYDCDLDLAEAEGLA